MGTINDIIEVVKGTASALGQKELSLKLNKNSIARGSANSILQFPVLTSNTISLDDLTMVSKALEREYATFIRVMVSLDDTINLDKGETKESKIRNFHQNFGTEGHTRLNFALKSESMGYTDLCKSFEEKNIQLLNAYCEDLNMTILNDLTNKNNNNYYNLGEAQSPKENADFARNRRDEKRKDAQEARNQEKHSWDRRDRAVRNHRDAEKHQWAAEDRAIKNQREAEKHDWAIEDRALKMSREQRDQERFGWEKQSREMQSQYRGVATNQILASDVKKANELVPTLLDISLYYSRPGAPMQETNVVLGVKAVSHLIETEEMVFNVSKAVIEKRAFFRFIQWTSGEINTWKDYILASDKLKREALSQRTNSAWWRRLKLRGAKERLKRFSKKDIMPNATLVLSMDEVEYIRNNYNIDLLQNNKAIKNIFDTFFLLGLVIVDPMSELAYFMFDGHSDYQVHSYRSLERENTSAGDVKSLISLIDKTK